MSICIKILEKQKKERSFSTNTVILEYEGTTKENTKLLPERLPPKVKRDGLYNDDG